jgi:predicted dehydrogenase
MKNLLLVGTGLMAREYFKVLKALEVNITVVGRGEQNALSFSNEFGMMPFVGGLKNFFSSSKMHFDFTIIAVGVDQLAEATSVCMENGCKRILLEKPGGLTSIEISNLEKRAQSCGAEVFIAYNRRFYSSVFEAKKIIASDGGLVSGNFEFTEWGHIISNLPVSDTIKSNYFLANSSHVVDLAFHLMGPPAKMVSYVSGETGWHKPAVFSGAGITQGGVVFNYSANWESAGRWGVELLTTKRKLILRPMEKLFEQKRGELEIRELPVEDSELDVAFKPGLWLQVNEFLSERGSSVFKSLGAQVTELNWMGTILSGGEFEL